MFFIVPFTNHKFCSCQNFIKTWLFKFVWSYRRICPSLESRFGGVFAADERRILIRVGYCCIRQYWYIHLPQQSLRLHSKWFDESAVRLSSESLAGAVSVAKGLPESVSSTLLHGAREAFTSSMHAVVAVSGGLMIAITFLTVIKLRHIRPIGQKAPSEMELSMQE